MKKKKKKRESSYNRTISQFIKYNRENDYRERNKRAFLERDKESTEAKKEGERNLLLLLF